LKTNLLFDHVGTQAFPIEFLERAFSADIKREKPNLMPDNKLDAFVFSVVVASLGVLGGFDVLDKAVVVNLESFSIFLGGGSLGVEVHAKVHAELGMVAVGSEEWLTFDRGLECIIVHELSKRQ
jgi:hypothetical protein